MLEKINARIFGSVMVLIFGSLLYGLAIGYYQIFPFKQLQKIKHQVDSFMPREEVSREKEVEIIDSALKRLLVKRVFLGGTTFTRAQYITNLDQVVYIITREGKLFAYHPETIRPYTVEVESVPMNMDEYLSSSVQDMDGYTPSHYKVSELYVEKKEDNVHDLYVTHFDYNPEKHCVTLNISRSTIQINQNVLSQESNWETIFTTEPCLEILRGNTRQNPFPGNMAGGKIIEYDEERLLVSIGDFHRDGDRFQGDFSMDPDVPYGKFLLLDKESGDYSVYAKGTRNAQGLFRDENGTIWSTEHGPQGGDKLNIVEKGNNYGWPEVAYGINYENKAWGNSNNQGRIEPYRESVFVWINSIAPTTVKRINSDERFSLWKGDLLISSLRDQSLHRLRIDDDNRVLYNEKIELGERIRDFTILDDGRLVFTTESKYLIVVEDGGPVYEDDNDEIIAPKISGLDTYDQLLGLVLDEDAELSEALSGEELFEQSCSSCHNLNDINSVGPHLDQIFSRKVGELDTYNYSSALSNREEMWTPDLMRSFLLNPEDKFANTSMQQISMSKAEADSIIKYLSSN